VALPAAGNRPARVVPQYDAGIGRVARTVAGPTASYRLTDDDLYVRARVRANRPARYQMAFHPTVQMAWTQPVVA
jgi:hypothetical protein